MIRAKGGALRNLSFDKSFNKGGWTVTHYCMFGEDKHYCCSSASTQNRKMVWLLAFVQVTVERQRNQGS